MFDPQFSRAGILWTEIVNFIQTAEGSVATALETFTAKQIIRHPQLDAGQRKLLTHRFAIEGKVGKQTPLELFLADRSALTPQDRKLIQSWQRSFVGLFAVVQIYPNGLEIMNWLTAKHYRIQFADAESQTAMTRLKVGEVIITQINPIEGIDWAILSPWVALGRLGKPKLAVAVGNFRQNYPHYLYSDAPETLAAAWESVAVYHDRFVEFFGKDEVTLAGKQLQGRIADFQTWLVDQNLASAGIDKSKSLSELAADAGVGSDDLQALTTTLGLTESSTAQTQTAAIGKMVPPNVELPADLKHAPAVTALSHPYWGQMFLPNYEPMRDLLAAATTQPLTAAQISSLQKTLADPQMNAFVWRRLASEYPQQLENAIGQLPGRAGFKLSTDLDPLLTQLNKYLEPDLPDLASVPLHLHELFQAAVIEVSKEKVKPKSQPKKTGFGAKS
jgi:hypothetical protein